MGSGGQATQALLASDATRGTSSSSGDSSARTSSSSSTASSRSADRGGTYTVRPGDTLWGIARDRLGADATNAEVQQEVQRIWHLNGAQIPSGDPDLILPGQEIRFSR
jgi:nucleoid-associated protein YgaU